VQAVEDVVRGTYPPILMVAHQLESVDARVVTNILKNIPIFQPRVDDAKPAKAGRFLQDSKEGKNV